VFVSGTICGTQPGATSGTAGIIHVTDAGTVTYIAGKYGGTSTSGTAANSFLFGTIRGLAVSGTTLYASQQYDVLKLTTTGGTVTAVAGIGTAGFSGDYGPGTSAKLNGVQAIAVVPAGHLMITDTNNHAVRMVW
jgi:serine/threonine-protein kinase